MARFGRAYPLSLAVKRRIPGQVTFGAVGAGTAGTGTSLSELHTIAGSGRAILAFINTHSPNAIRPTIGVTCGGVAMAELGTIMYYNPAPDFETVTAFGLLNPASGSQSIAATFGASVTAALNSVSYNNVASFSTVVTNSGASGSASLSVPSAVGQMVAMAFSAYTTNFSGFNQTSRWNLGFNVGVNVAMMIGDAAGANPVAFSASAGTAFGGVGVPMLPA